MIRAGIFAVWLFFGLALLNSAQAESQLRLTSPVEEVVADELTRQ
jgi:hypothetical protein